MSGWLGGAGGPYVISGFSGLSSPPWRFFLTLSDLVEPGPSSTVLFLDEREDANNTGNFGIDMTGFPDQPKFTQFGEDMPASYHNGAGGLSFADGHVETKRWLDPRTTPPIRKNSNWIFLAGTTPSPSNPDIVWLQQRATSKAP